ncbi:hypothetical protein [Sporosarcina sp. P17b]|uniref:phage tail fiber protein n=1 Tax=Sporosarcina sp. P17b TaxID=2048260 RepID=UPI000C16D0D3|nr:hypothetical protein [Sporosarcina sp. P17b]PIC72439.1 hypothetical protein CSV76_15455 [Sporosarcina sp. P17b]
MDNMTTYLKNKVLNQELTGVHVALFSGAVEVAKASYTRKPVTFAAAADGQTSNNADILFPIAQEVWGEITHIAIFDAATAGNMLFMSPAEFVKTIDVSSQYKIPKNYLIVRLR